MPNKMIELAIRVLSEAKTSMTAREIWEYAQEKGYDVGVTQGDTPLNSLSASLGTYDKKKECNILTIKDDKPYKFSIKGEVTDTTIKPPLPPEKMRESELHPVLVKFVKTNRHFKAYSKTINHLKSKKMTVGYNEWLHPDIVSVFFPFDDNYDKQIINLQNKMSISTVKIFAFELKLEITKSNLREYYFQAVSNSSWANEGYLVAQTIDETNDELMDEMRRLNNAFGIGVIVLNKQSPADSKIIYPALFKTDVDWDTINRLITINDDFRAFLDAVYRDINNAIVNNKGNYDYITP